MIFNIDNELLKYNKIYNKVYINYLECHKNYIEKKNYKISNLSLEEINNKLGKYKCKEFNYPYCICNIYYKRTNIKLDGLIDINSNIIEKCINNKKNKLYIYNLNDLNDICIKISEDIFKKWKIRNKINKKITYNIYFKFFYNWLNKINKKITYNIYFKFFYNWLNNIKNNFTLL